MKNEYGIDEIEFERTIYPFCPMGKDHYKGTVHVNITPQDKLFDFSLIDEKIKKLGEKSLIIEELAAEVFQIMQEYNPAQLEVTIYGESNQHFPVIVRKKK